MKTWWNTLKLSKWMTKFFFGTEKRFLGSLWASRAIKNLTTLHCNSVQGQYRARTGFSLCSKFSQGKTCFHYREPLFSLQFLYSLQGISCENYYTERSLKSLQGMSLQWVLKKYMDKVKTFCEHSMIKWEMAGVRLTNAMGWIRPPPMSFRVEESKKKMNREKLEV